MSWNPRSLRLALVAAVLAVAACQDLPETTGPEMAPTQGAEAARAAQAAFDRAVPEVMALDRTVFAARDEATNRIVIGVENAGIRTAVARVMTNLGIDASAYEVVETEPIHFASDDLRSRHRPTQGGLQIHWSNYLCTLGFNVDHSGGRSFITNSHCTTSQGSTGSTAYYQPSSSEDPSAIAVEAHDPSYFRGGQCSRGKVCRYSDSSRALYQSSAESTRGSIAKTTGVNNGSTAVSGNFTITSQDNSGTSFSGTVHKVGRTTGWTSGNVTSTCATVNVSGSNIQLLCQTLVQNSSATIVQGGDSGSPVFRVSSGDDVELLGILWGGSSSGDLFVFSPLKSIQDELGGVTATSDGTGGGDGGGDDGGDGGDDGGDDDDGGDCIPRGPNGNNCK